MQHTMEDLPRENLRPTPPAFYNTPPISICKSLIEGFSTNDRRRHPTWANKDSDDLKVSPIHVRLITIGPSHYCEKARWALDIAESSPNNPYYFTEDAHPPLFQGLATLKASGGEISMTPMVVFKEPKKENANDAGKETLIYDSGKIVKYFCPHLYPPPIEKDIKEVESYIGSHIGATARCYIYYHLLNPQYYNVLAEMLTQNSSLIEKFLWRKLLGRGMAEGMKKAMKINAESAELSLKTIRSVFHELSERLKVENGTLNEKKDYLMDTEDQKYGFTAADLTLAAIAAPLIAPPELETFIKADDDLTSPNALVELKYELRETLAGKHVLEMYKKHRIGNDCNTAGYGSISTSVDNESRTVIPKVVGRNKFPLGALTVTIGAAFSLSAVWTKGNPFRSKL